MRKVGCDAELLIDAIQSAVTPEGQILMLLCAEENIPFDPATSKAWHELGILSEIFRNRSGVTQNDHPAARMGAMGAGRPGVGRESTSQRLLRAGHASRALV